MTVKLKRNVYVGLVIIYWHRHTILYIERDRQRRTGGCFTNVSRTFQDILSKFVYCGNRTSYDNFKLKFSSCTFVRVSAPHSRLSKGQQRRKRFDGMGLLPDTQNCGCACAGNAGNVFPSPQVSDPDMHHGTCVTHVPWCMPGSLTSGFLWHRRRGKTFPAFPAHAQPAILHIW